MKLRAFDCHEGNTFEFHNGKALIKVHYVCQLGLK